MNIKYDDIAHYCIVRDDIKRGVAMAQLIHAAGESSPGNLPKGVFAIALAAKDEQQLLDLEQKLLERGIPHHAIREPDAPWNGAIMAIGACPGPRKQLRKHFSNFPLLRERTG